MTITAIVSSHPLPSDLALVERHRLGDAAAFEELYARYETMVFNLALRLTGDETEAADCSQEAFLRIYRYLGRFRGRSTLKTWVYRVTVNCCRSRYARRMRRRGVVASFERQELERVADPGRGPEVRAIDSDLAGRVKKTLACVKPVYREALVLRDVEGLTYGEIAAVLGIRLGTVRSRIARGRQEARRLMELET